ncbi:hypothetical protein A4S06_02135 [Erysipelotrichaceae bacterium MTC7]|nr:hypothetical protein A4S06_02135 [Erysipelotrichaceae bacterium MTC7]
MDVRDDIKQLENEICLMRRELHQIPETGFETKQTLDYVVNKLTGFGYDNFDFSLAKNSVVVQLRVNDEPTSIGFRSDMDALPLKEETKRSFASVNGNSHACGHDGHMAALLGLCKYVMDHKEHIKKNITFVFQPAEEGPGGAKVMIENGLFQLYPMECIIGVHVMGEVEAGRIACKAGPMMARNGELFVNITGKGTHGATPHLGSDAIVAGSAFVSALQSITSRNINPLHSSVVTIGTFHAGSAENIIAETCAMKGTIRSFQDEAYEKIKERIQEIAEGVSKTYNVTIDAKIVDYYFVVDNDEKLYKLLEDVLQDDLQVVEPKMVAEDFSFYQKEIPGLFYYIGTHTDQYDQNLHSAKFDFDETVLLHVIETNVRLLEGMHVYD